MALITFIFAAVVSGFVQREFNRRVAEADATVRTDRDFARNILDRPGSVISESFAESVHRRRALLKRQSDPTTERLRILSWLTLVALIVAFGWWSTVGH
jgi:hypothetical protein